MSKNRRFRSDQPKPATAGGAGPSSHIALEQQRRALEARVLGPHHEAEAAVKGDAGLTRRLSAAIDQGLAPIDLETVPLYRRPQVVEEALDAFETTRVGGPCRLCGSATKRPGWFPRGVMDIDDSAAFTNGLCLWCREYRTDHTEDELLQRVFQLVTGTRHEAYHQAYPASHPNAAGKGNGTPWSHVPSEVLRQIVLTDARYHRSYVTTATSPRPQPTPGLPEPHLWNPADLPARTVTYLPLSAADRRREEESAAAVAKLKEHKAREAADRQRHCAALAARDAKLEAMTEDERADYWRHAEPFHQAQLAREMRARR